MPVGKPTSYRFSEHARELINRLSEALGISRTAFVELAVRQLARRELPGYTPGAPDPRGRSRKSKKT